MRNVPINRQEYVLSDSSYTCWTLIPAEVRTWFLNADELIVLDVYSNSQASRVSSSSRKAVIPASHHRKSAGQGRKDGFQPN